MIVRYSKENKENALALGKAMHLESRFRHLDFSDNRVLALLEQPNVFGAFSVYNDYVTGFFLGVVQPMWFSEKKLGFDLALYIKPEYRKRRTRDAIGLIKAFEEFCVAHGCTEMNLGSTAEISTQSAKRLYAKLGYTECGFVSRKEL
jgi:GNAT superfamily N-acetyltransferase